MNIRRRSDILRGSSSGPNRLAFLLAAVVAVSAVGFAAGCGDTRSAAAVCNVWITQTAALHAKYQNDATHRPVTAIEDIVSAPSDIAGLMGNMAAVAPTPIEGDLSTLQNAFKRIASSEGDGVFNPGQAIAKNVVTAVQAAGPVERVDSYVSTNCQGTQ